MLSCTAVFTVAATARRTERLCPSFQMADQGVPHPYSHGRSGTVADPKTMCPVRARWHIVGEIMVRRNTVMKGTSETRPQGPKNAVGKLVSLSDLAVWDPDGALAIKDRSKDIIIHAARIFRLEVDEVLTQTQCYVGGRSWPVGPDMGETPSRVLRTQAGAAAGR